MVSSEQKTTVLSKQLAGEKNESKQEKKVERKPRFRYLTDEMLEKYHRISEESDLYRKQYEEAAFRVYGTLPARKMTFQAAGRKNGK